VRSILEKAYEWNKVAKQRVLDFNLEPILPDTHALWDRHRMKPFEETKLDILGGGIISVVSFGLSSSEATASSDPVPRVQEKSAVVTKEWVSQRKVAFPGMAHTPGGRNVMSLASSGMFSALSEARRFLERPSPTRLEISIRRAGESWRRRW
jgi:hypothetical protein